MIDTFSLDRRNEPFSKSQVILLSEDLGVHEMPSTKIKKRPQYTGTSLRPKRILCNQFFEGLAGPLVPNDLASI
jgi:hypothetical protein